MFGRFSNLVISLKRVARASRSKGLKLWGRVNEFYNKTNLQEMKFSKLGTLDASFGRPVVMIHGDGGKVFPFEGEIVGPSGKLIRVHVYRSESIRSRDGKLAKCESGQILVTQSVRDAVIDTSRKAESLSVNLRFPQFTKAHVRPVQWHDAPAPGFIVMSRKSGEDCTTRFFSGRWAMVSTGLIMLPVRVITRDDRTQVEENEVRIPLSLRTIAGVSAGDEIQIAPLLRPTAAAALEALMGRVSARRNLSKVRRRFLVLGGVCKLATRRLDWFIEVLLRRPIGAPSVVLGVKQAGMGDDENGVSRVHPDVLSLIAARPGDSIIVQWGPWSCSTIVLPWVSDQQGLDKAGELARKRQAVEILPENDSASHPVQLSITLPAAARQALRMPADTAVVVRRRIRPVVQAGLTALLVPVGGLAVAAAALRNIDLNFIMGGAGVISVFYLAALRIPRAPKGLWP